MVAYQCHLWHEAASGLAPKPDTDSNMNDRLIYKIATRDQWQQAEKIDQFDGAPVDLADGYIHFSTAGQVAETAARHFAGQDDLLLVAVRTGDLGEELRYEPSRGGALFPHLYAPLKLSAVEWTVPMPLENGRHVLPTFED